MIADVKRLIAYREARTLFPKSILLGVHQADGVYANAPEDLLIGKDDTVFGLAYDHSQFVMPAQTQACIQCSPCRPHNPLQKCTCFIRLDAQQWKQHVLVP